MKIKFLLPIALVALISFFILFGPNDRGDSDDLTNVNQEKQEFFIETKKFGDFPQSAQIKKIGKITGAQDINMTASVAGRVVDVKVKAGDNVTAGQSLVVLSDNITNYGINLDRSSNAVARAQINYDAQKLSLDKQVLDAEINLEKLQANLEALKKTADQNILRAQNDVDSVNPDKTGSKASLDLEKLDQNIAKLELDYENLLASDRETLDGFQNNFGNFFNGYTTLVVDIAQLGDELFGITDFNRNNNDDFDTFLGANNLTQKNITESQARNLLKVLGSSEYQTLYDQITNTTMTNTQIFDGVTYVSEGYDDLESFLNNLETTLNNSLRSVGSFSEADVNLLLTEVNGYQAQYQSSDSALNNFETNTKTFLNTYENNQKSVAKQIELAQKDREILVESLNDTLDNARIGFENTIISQADQIKNLETQVKNANNQLSNAISNREISLASAGNSINDAQINLNEASKNYNKLIITAPVSGTIGDVFVDIGQEVSNGTSIVTLVSNSDKEISVGFSKDEVSFVSIGDEVFLESGDNRYTGSILSLSSVSDSNLNYKATIGFNKEVDLLGDLVSVYVLAQNKYVLFPINLVEVVKPGTGFIKAYSGSTIENLEIQLGDVWQNEIEVKSQIDAGVDIIINNVSNYNPNKFELKLR